MKYSLPHKHQHMLTHASLFGLYKVAWHQKNVIKF